MNIKGVTKYKLHRLSLKFKNHNDMERALLALKRKKIGFEIDQIESYDFCTYKLDGKEGEYFYDA